MKFPTRIFVSVLEDGEADSEIAETTPVAVYVLERVGEITVAREFNPPLPGRPRKRRV